MERLFILGCGSALPASRRNPTAQILEHSGRFFLIDCGEGTQSRLRENKLSFDKITHVFISHMHGDHYLGLPGLISTMQLLGRKRSLNIYGPPELWELLQFQFKVSKTFITFPIEFSAVESEYTLFETDKISIRSIELNHRINCYGFIFEEKGKSRRINGPVAKEMGVPHFFMEKLRNGEDFQKESGEIIPNKELTFDPHPSYSYAFCSDNRIKAGFFSKLQGVSHLYHESTFIQKDLERAKKTYHTTVKEAIDLGEKVGVDTLLLGHYSARYKTLEEISNEAVSRFIKVVLVEEGMEFRFNN